MKTQKPCLDCGIANKKPGHPRWCALCIERRLPTEKQADLARARLEAMEHRCGDLGIDLPKRPHKATWPEGWFWCHGCYSFRRSDFFGASATQCKACVSSKGHARMVAKTYGLEDGEYQSMMRAQGDKCAICRRAQKMRRLAVHHDHKTGKVNCLLCTRCNHDLLGAGFDSPNIMLCAYAVQVGGWEAVTVVLNGGFRALAEWLNDHPAALIGTYDAEPELAPY